MVCSMHLTKMVILFRQKIMKFFYFSSKKIENCGNIISSNLNRKQVRTIFSSDVQEIYKSSYSRFPMDIFPELNIHCFYDDKNQLEAIEIFEPNKFFLEDISFNWLGKINDEIISYLYKSGINDFEIDDFGIRLLNIPVSTIINSIGKVECCYLDFSNRDTKFYVKQV